MGEPPVPSFYSFFGDFRIAHFLELFAVFSQLCCILGIRKLLPYHARKRSYIHVQYHIRKLENISMLCIQGSISSEQILNPK